LSARNSFTHADLGTWRGRVIAERLKRTPVAQVDADRTGPELKLPELAGRGRTNLCGGGSPRHAGPDNRQPG
jgi:hypothetical protein